MLYQITFVSWQIVYYWGCSYVLSPRQAVDWRTLYCTLNRHFHEYKSSHCQPGNHDEDEVLWYQFRRNFKQTETFGITWNTFLLSIIVLSNFCAHTQRVGLVIKANISRNRYSYCEQSIYYLHVSVKEDFVWWECRGGLHGDILRAGFPSLHITVLGS